MIDVSTKTYANILQSMLSRVPDTFDKRDTSPIQTALGPAAYALEEFYLNLNNVQLAASIQTAAGDDLDEWAFVASISRYPASAAVRLGIFNVEVPIGSRFSTINGASSINFSVTSQYSSPSGGNYYYALTAETVGTIGNEYSGAILPISVVPGLTSAVISDILVLGDNAETDEALRARIEKALTDRPFGGNIASYRDAVMAMDGVGAVQVYPTWNGGGTVKLSILGTSTSTPETSYLPASATVIDNVQTAVDPTVNQGQGLGIAPIGAVVTVVAPSTVSINVTGTVSLSAGYTIEQVKPLIEAALQEYLLTTRQAWATPDAGGGITYSSSVYYARVVSAMLSAEGVVNVTSVRVNGGSADIALTETGATQQVAILGTVTVSE